MDYQCFIAELGFVAAAEAEANSHPTWAAPSRPAAAKTSAVTRFRLVVKAREAAVIRDGAAYPPCAAITTSCAPRMALVGLRSIFRLRRFGCLL